MYDVGHKQKSQKSCADCGSLNHAACGAAERQKRSTDSNDLRIRPIPAGWEFVNLFFDRQAAVFYCRIRKIEIEKPQNDWREVTAAGATMQIAFDRACEAAAA